MGNNIKNHLKQARNIQMIKRSKFFDRQWYMNSYSEIDYSKISPELHYLTQGWKKSYNPSPYFNSQEYLDLYSDVKNIQICPLLHYELFGKKEGRAYTKNCSNNENIYKTHFIRRFILRHIGRIVFFRTIRKNKNKRILVCLHLFYENSFMEIKEYLKNLAPYNYDLCITYPKKFAYDKLINEITAFKPDVKLIPFDNLGFDIAPYVAALDSYDLTHYDIIFKLHSKGTARETIYIYEQFFYKRDWFLYLFEGILGPFNVHKTIRLLTEDNDCGIVGAKNLIVHDPPHKQRLLSRWMKELNLNIPDADYKYIAGTCFAVRADLQNHIKKLNIKPSDFSESKRGFFSLAHAVERILCIDIVSQGYKIYGNNCCELRHYISNTRKEEYQKTSAIRLLYDDRFILDDEFFYRGLENKRIKNWDIVEIPLNKIRRKWTDGIFYSLTECAPYKYLNGDTQAYEEYCEYHHLNNLPDMTKNRFDTLIKSIEENGYNPKDMIVIGSGNILLDGQHRACCLMHMYSESLRVNVLKITFANDPFTLRKKHYNAIAKQRLTETFRMLLSFGTSLAIILSYTSFKSIGWAILHGIFNWFYVLYYAIRY